MGENDSQNAAAFSRSGKASGYVPMAPRAGALQFVASDAVSAAKLPNKVDLRPLLTPIEDQGDTNSCVANAVAGAYEYWIKKATKADQSISRLFVYYNARWRDGSQNEDGGSVIQLAMEGLRKFGACSESLWPFETDNVLRKPGDDAYQDGAPHRVHDMAQVPLELETWKQALAEGKPIVFGIELFDTFDDCTDRGGVVPMPAPTDLTRKKHSGHSMCAVGYNESEKVFIIRNSWGSDWGDGGYCYMPYGYLLNEKFNDGDCWTFIPKVTMAPPHETWDDSTTPVTNGGRGVDFDIQPYSAEDYQKIAVDLFELVRRPWNAETAKGYGDFVDKVSATLTTSLGQSGGLTSLLEKAAILEGAGLVKSWLSGQAPADQAPAQAGSEPDDNAGAPEASAPASDGDDDSAKEPGDAKGGG